MAQPFEAIREELLRAGIAPGYARRCVTELREHLSDLTEHERSCGLDEKEAAERAAARLGSAEQLVQAIIEKGAPRSLTARTPCAVFAALPIVLLLGALLANTALMMHLLWPVRELPPSAMPAGYRELVALMSFVANDLVGAILIAGCIGAAVRQRLQSSWPWIGIALIALFNALLGFHVHIIPPEDAHGGGAMYSVAAVIYSHGRISLAATLAGAALHATVLFTISAAVYLTLRMRRTPA